MECLNLSDYKTPEVNPSEKGVRPLYCFIALILEANPSEKGV